jgi:hypothetical protein
MKRKGLDAMAVFAQLLVLIAIFLLASYANAFLNLNQVAGNQIWLNHLIWFKETNKQNSSAKTALKATAEMQPSADSNNTTNTLSFRHTASSTIQLVVASIDGKFLNGSTKPLANNFGNAIRLSKNWINAKWRLTKLRRTISGMLIICQCVNWLVAA